MKILSFVGITLTVICCFQECSAQWCTEEDREEWSYHGFSNGPSVWGETFPTCDGDSQSPIHIKLRQVTKDPELKHLVMNNYDEPVTDADVFNNGETVRVVPQDDVSRNITVNGDVYALDHLHFHWGGKSNVGSEHVLNSRAYAMEAHFVHFNADGDIAVVGVLFQSYYKSNLGFKPIAEVLPQVQFKGERAQLLTPLYLRMLLPQLPLPIYRYSGSLTTPGCTEGVTWSVAQDVVKIGRRQLNELRNLYSVEREDKNFLCHLQNNYRPVQPLNGRKVTSSTQ